MGRCSVFACRIPTGPAAVRRLPDAVHPGKTEKGEGENLFSLSPFFVFISPVDGLCALSMGLPSRKKRTANGRPYGIRSPCFARKKVCSAVQQHRGEGVQRTRPLARGTGGAEPPAPFLKAVTRSSRQFLQHFLSDGLQAAKVHGVDIVAFQPVMGLLGFRQYLHRLMQAQIIHRPVERKAAGLGAQ